MQRCSTIRSSKPSKRAERSVTLSSCASSSTMLLRQLPALRRERDHAMGRRAAVDRVERRRDDVDPQHHPRPAPVGLVVDAARVERGRVAVGEEPQVELAAEHRGERALLRQPREGRRNEREDIEAQRSQSGSEKPGATRIRPASSSTASTHAATSGSSSPVAEVERVVRRAGDDVLDAPEGAPALLDHLEPDELEGVVLALVGRRQRRPARPRAAFRARQAGRA